VKFDWDEPPQDFRSAVWCFPIIFYLIAILVFLIAGGIQRLAGIKTENFIEPIMLLIAELLLFAFCTVLLLTKSKWFRLNVLVIPLVWILAFSVCGITQGAFSVSLRNCYLGRQK